MEKKHTNAVSRQLVYARENGMLDWDWIVDETREAERIASWDDPRQFVKSASGSTGRTTGAISPNGSRYGRRRARCAARSPP